MTKLNDDQVKIVMCNKISQNIYELVNDLIAQSIYCVESELVNNGIHPNRVYNTVVAMLASTAIFQNQKLLGSTLINELANFTSKVELACNSIVGVVHNKGRPNNEGC